MNLFIDTHLNNVVIILEKNKKIIKKEIIKNKKQNSTVIMPSIQKVLENKFPDSIIVVNGPGSFTGVRLGVTIAKTLAYTLNIPIRVISYLECMAISENNDNCIVALNDGNGYYIGIFDSNINLIGNYEYLSNNEYEEFRKKYDVILDVELDYIKIIEWALLKEAINAHKVNPVYIKKIDVEK